MKSKKTAVFTLLLMLFSGAALSAPARMYDVQVLVFSHLTPQTVSARQWPVLSNADVTAFSNNISSPAQSAAALQPEVNALKKYPDYQVLFSSAWKESWPGDKGSVTIPISNGNNLRGNMTIVLGHYFDVHTDLLFSAPTSTLQKMDTSGYFNHISDATFYFRLNENRRMRSKELNYLQLPVMGVLIKMIPIKET